MSEEGELGVSVGFQFVSAISMAWDVLSSSVRRTVALLSSPAIRASSRDCLKESKCDRRCIMGHRSVDRPRSVSTAFSGEIGIERSGGTGNGNGVDVGCVLVFGAVPRDRAAMTS